MEWSLGAWAALQPSFSHKISETVNLAAESQEGQKAQLSTACRLHSALGSAAGAECHFQ